MKKKVLFTLTLIAFSALIIGACAPLEPVSAQSVPVESAAEIVQISTTPTTMPVNNKDSSSQSMQDRSGNGNFPNQEDCDGTPSFVSDEALTETEIEGLNFMREEEKLARDVYLTLYNQWGLPVFQNIASSEQKHTDAVKGLLEFYGVTDPVVDETIGVFVNEDLQALYNQLIEKGSLSLVDALEVGTAIEEIDILDLQELIAETENVNIIMVYSNLLKGSNNHLRAFVSQYEGQSGEKFSPSYMSLEEYNDAVSSSAMSGRGSGQNQGQGGGLSGYGRRGGSSN